MREHVIATKDALEITAKTALSVIPVGGTLITCVWDTIKANCAQDRLDDWKALLEKRLTTVEATVEDIGNNERFTTAMMKATDSAIKTMEEDKRKYLANAVLNTLDCEIEESILMMYFDLIDKYTIWHIRILDFYSNPKKFNGVSVDNYFLGSPLEPLYSVYPELQQHDKIVDKIIKDLYADGVLNTENMRTAMSPSGMVASRTTELGNDLIEFITQK